MHQTQSGWTDNVNTICLPKLEDLKSSPDLLINVKTRGPEGPEALT